MRALALAVFALTLAGCAALPSAGLRAEARPAALVLRNETGRTLYYVAAEAEAFALIELVPDVRVWPSLGPGEEKALAYAELPGYTEGAAQALVVWSDERRRGRVAVRL